MTILSPAIKNLLETFNADVAMATKDGAQYDELIGIAGAITESILKTMVKSERKRHWDAMVGIMERRFQSGVI